MVSVHDHGMGVPSTELEHIFSGFHRGSNVSGRIAGTGIGLATARQVVEQHGGTISVESVEHQGSTFVVRLPLGEPPGRLSDDSPAPNVGKMRQAPLTGSSWLDVPTGDAVSDAPSSEDAFTPHARILVIDDDRQVRQAIQWALEDDGFPVHWLPAGRKPWQWHASGSPTSSCWITRWSSRMAARLRPHSAPFS